MDYRKNRRGLGFVISMRTSNSSESETRWDGGAPIQPCGFDQDHHSNRTAPSAAVSCGPACRPQRVYEGMESAVESLLGTLQRPRRAAALHQDPTQIFFTLGMKSLPLGRRVGGRRRGAADAGHKERNNERPSSHNATVFESEVRGHVWLCARLSWTD